MLTMTAKTAPGAFGLRIAELRGKAGLTQRQLAAHAGIDQGTVSRIERGGMENPTMQTLTSLAAALGVPAQALLPPGDPEPSPETRLERDEDEVLPVAERAIVALGRTTEEERERLRERIVEMQFRTDDPVSAYVSLLERELSRVRAEASGGAPKTVNRAEAVKTELPANIAKFGRKKK